MVGVIMISTFSCTNQDKYFGDDLIPPGEQMGTAIDSSIQVQTYIFAKDSMQTNGLGYQSMIGTLIDPLVGRTHINMFSNFAPIGFIGDKYFGVDPVIDSMNIAFTFSSQYGDTTQKISIEVYEVVSHNFYVDSVYYSNFDMTPYINPVPLLTFEAYRSDLIVKKLPIEYARKFLDNTPGESNPYFSDTAFHRRWNGLYLKAKPLTSGRGNTLTIDLSQSVLNLFYHNNNPEKKDTTSQRMLFNSDYTFYNTNFVMVDHDYSYADPAKGGVRKEEIGDTINPSKWGYIQGFAGLGTTVKIPKAQIDALKAKIQRPEEGGYSTIALHKAELIFESNHKSWENYDSSFNALGLYYDMLNRRFIPDYNPILDQLQTGYKSTLGGGLNRSIGKYKMDITSYMQRLIRGASTDTTLQIYPPYDFKATIGRAGVYGSASENPPKLVLIYTMLR